MGYCGVWVSTGFLHTEFGNLLENLLGSIEYGGSGLWVNRASTVTGKNRDSAPLGVMVFSLQCIITSVC